MRRAYLLLLMIAWTGSSARIERSPGDKAGAGVAGARDLVGHALLR